MTAARIIRQSMEAHSGDDPLAAALRDRFGHPGFRPGQREVVETVVAGRDAVVVMPTGGGKSLCYQLPAVLGRAPTVVVAPLIALMKDQVDGLERSGIAAAALHSNLDAAEQRAIEARYLEGRLSLLYVAPERLTRRDLRALLTARRPERIVVDEAHCISEWGHDFRRDYLRIGEVADELRPVQLVACTATATPAVRDDIATRLALRDPAVFVRGFARPGLHLSVERVRGEAEKLVRLDAVIDPGDGHAIVYAGTRARAAEVAERLARRHATMLYHADLSPAQRAAAQERFASGEVRVAVATSAFGMGVDVATVRQVVHLALPASLEEYYQQAGRAGRDGGRARCVLIYTSGDRRLPEFFIDAAHPDPARLAAVALSLRRQGSDPGAWRLVSSREAAVAALADAAGDAALAVLREAGVVRPDGGLADGVDPRHLPVDHGRITRHRQLALDRFSHMADYLVARGCRHRVILDHFGEADGPERCGDACDLCGRGAAGGAAARPADILAVRKALSAVARVNGRIGLARVAAVLTGSAGRALREMPWLHELPTFGALSGWREADAAELLRRLVDAGLLSQASGRYPTVALTARGVAVMRGDAVVDVEDPRGAGALTGGRGSAAGAEAAELDAAGAAVLERLRRWRSEVARANGWPAYIVFGDRTLHALAALRPGDHAALALVPGVGPGKLRLYGAEVLGIVSGLAEPRAAGAPGEGAPVAAAGAAGDDR